MTFSARGLLLKKKLLLPILLLLKLKLKALMPIFVALIGLKALKALILSKLAIAIVIGFVAYQLFSKSGKFLCMDKCKIYCMGMLRNKSEIRQQSFNTEQAKQSNYSTYLKMCLIGKNG